MGKQFEKQYIMYMYNWITLLYTETNNIENQLYSNKIFRNSWSWWHKKKILTEESHLSLVYPILFTFQQKKYRTR